MNPSRKTELDALLQRALGGDRAARDELFQAVRRYLFLLVRGCLEGTHGPDFNDSSLVQETYVRLTAQFQDADGPFRGTTVAEFFRWVGAVARNTVAAHIRHAHAQKRDVRRRTGEAAFAAYADGQPLPDEAAVAVEDLLRTAAALERLDPRRREVIQLRYFEGLSFAEVADRVGVTESHARVLHLRAVKDLQGQLGGFS